jgi:catechol-2,3-dioxygenase
MIKVLRIGHATFETPDLAKAIEHYTQVIGLSLAGREDKRAFLATKIGQLAIELHQGTQARCSKLSFEVRSRCRLRRLRRELQKHGVAAESAMISFPACPRCCRSRTRRARRSSCSASGA